MIQNYFGGKILKVIFKDETGHFWNLIADKEIDLIKIRFDKNEIIPKPTIHSREKIENNSGDKKCNKKYLIFKKGLKNF